MGMYTDVIINKKLFPTQRKDDLKEFVNNELTEAEFTESEYFYEFTVRKFGYAHNNKEKLAAFLQKLAKEELYYESKVLTRYEENREFTEWDWQSVVKNEVE